MTDDGHPDDLVGAYVLEACSPDEARSVAEHASHCPSCAAEIARLSRAAEWVAVTTASAPDPELRSRVLSAALAARSASPSPVGPVPEVHRLVEPYRMQVAAMDRLLGGLSQPQWLLPAGPHRSVRDLVVHLSGNDGLVAAATGLNSSTLDDLPSTSDVWLRWRGQAHAIVDRAARQGPQLLQRQVGLAGRAAIRGPVREALIQRGYETWIHAEDIRAALRLTPQTPSAHQLTDIVSFASRLLPAAMDAAGRAHPGKAIRLGLTGVGAGTSVVSLSAASTEPATVVAELSLTAERFCRLLAGRLVAASTDIRISGEARAATDFLAVASTMGCD